jgi:hypothetical protein
MEEENHLMFTAARLIIEATGGETDEDTAYEIAQEGMVNITLHEIMCTTFYNYLSLASPASPGVYSPTSAARPSSWRTHPAAQFHPRVLPSGSD